MPNFAKPLADLVRGQGNALTARGTPVVSFATSGFGVAADTSGRLPAGVEVARENVRMTYTGTAQVTTNNSETGVALDTVRFDSHDLAVPGGAGTSYILCKTAGKYLVHGEIEFAADADGSRKLWIAITNTSSRYSQDERPGHATKATKLCTTGLLDLVANDKVYLMCLQDSGGNLQINKEAQQSPEFWAVRVA